MLTPEQSRAARGWLDWSQDDLARGANVSLSTVRDFEKRRRVPISNNLDAMRRALEGAGVRLVFDHSDNPVGVAVLSPAQAGQAESELRLESDVDAPRG
jgi:ribosome-binding protein aMBF1 (putative translation factor)